MFLFLNVGVTKNSTAHGDFVSGGWMVVVVVMEEEVEVGWEGEREETGGELVSLSLLRSKLPKVTDRCVLTSLSDF